MRDNVVLVAVDQASFHFDKLYSYRLPPSAGEVTRGCRVLVPFGGGNRQRQGIVVRTDTAEDTARLKPIAQVLEREPLLDGEMMDLALWLKERTFCTVFDAVRAMLPTGLYMRLRPMLRLAPKAEDRLEEMTPEERQIVSFLAKCPAAGVEQETLLKKLGLNPDAPGLLRLLEWGAVQRSEDAFRQVGDASIRMARLALEGEALDEALSVCTDKQKAVVRLLRDVGCASVKELCYFASVTTVVVAALVKKGVVEYYENEVLRSPYKQAEELPAIVSAVLSGEQQAAYDALLSRYREGKPACALLHGITGSGKTQVYMNLIDQVLEDGRQVLVLVPEISLTPQMMRLFLEKYGRRVAVLHSALAIGERMDEWKRVKRGEARVVVGTRSAVFAPCDNLGLIVMDEEQEHTYKSENTPRYHAREVALYRGLRAGALVVFGSATPSVETMYHAKCGDLALYTLKERFNRQAMPRVELVDLKQELRQGNAGIVSTALEERLRDTVIRGDQAILFLNRRGNSRCLVCVDCGDAPSCPRCSVYLTYHSVTNRLMCHYCGYSEPVTERCPHCGGALRPVGAGTQKVEEELRYEFPDTGILRMDADTVTAANSHEAILERFRRKEASILVGTQMVAKGLDFASVTLAGVLDADLSLYVNHYRAAETTFSLVTQLVGRSGRGADTGTAVIQTMCPEHPVLKLAAAQDYDGFYDMEIALRELRNVPPFRDLFTVTFTGLFEEHVRAAAKRFRDALAMNLRQSPYAGMEFDLLGPAPAAIAKVNYTYRYRATLSCKNTKEVRALLRFLLGAFAKDKQNKGVSAFVDVNAYD